MPKSWYNANMRKNHSPKYRSALKLAEIGRTYFEADLKNKKVDILKAIEEDGFDSIPMFQILIDEYVPYLAKLLMDSFTRVEMDTLSEFYLSPIGSKSLRLTNQLNKDTSKFVKRLMERLMADPQYKKVKETPDKETTTVICQQWEESERGWGQRPDGFSLHLTEKHRMQYIAKHNASLPKEVPDEYERPCGRPYNVEVGKELYKELQESGGSSRESGTCPSPPEGATGVYRSKNQPKQLI